MRIVEEFSMAGVESPWNEIDDMPKFASASEEMAGSPIPRPPAAPLQLPSPATCGRAGGTCHTGRERYGCVEHYRRKSCGNGRTVRRRAIRLYPVLDEAAAR